MREAWKWETDVPSQSFSPKSAVKYLHVWRRKIQISPPLGEQDQSNALPKGQQRQTNPHPCVRVGTGAQTAATAPNNGVTCSA